MRFAVRYYTKTGNTKRLAEAIANELGVEALPISEPVKEQVDFLFLGNSYYAFDIDAEFHCKGEFKGIHKGRPNENDLKDAVEFAKQYK